MADETKDTLDEATPSEPAAAKRRPLPRKALLFAGIALGQLGLALGLAHFVILPRLPSPAGDAEAAVEADADGDTGKHGEKAKAGEHGEGAAVARGTIVLMENVVVNLQGEDRTHFLKVAPGLEVADAHAAAELEERMPELRDLVISHFASRGVAEVIGREGREQVKQELLADINNRLLHGKVLNIYFSDFVVQ
jgi:flagellar basal body-associated protein FliL